MPIMPITESTDGAATLEAGGKQIGVKVENGNLAEQKLDEGGGLLLTTNAPIKWTIEDEKIANLDRDGRMTALRQGVTKITCKAETAGNGQSGSS